jgi:phage terminase large subunit
MMLRASESNILPPEELAALRAKMEPDEYEQEMECSWEATTRGRIISRLVEEADKAGRINDQVTWDPHGAAIEVSSDIGFYDTAAWWFWQPAADGYRLLKYVQGSGMDALDWAKELQKQGYRIHTLWLPQDAKAQTMAAAASVQEQMAAYGYATTLVPRVSIRDRINAARTVIRKCWFHKTDCAEGLEALLNWSYKWNEETYSYSRDPLHDQWSHGGDAFSYGACTIFGASPVSAEENIVALPDFSIKKPKVKRALTSGR